MSSWPAALRLQTRKILDGLDPFPKDGILRMKNSNNFSAYLKQEDLRNGQIILYDTETQLTNCFQNAGEMFDAGWVADLQPNSHLHLLAKTESMTELNALPVTEEEIVNTQSPDATRVVPLKACITKERV